MKEAKDNDGAHCHDCNREEADLEANNVMIYASEKLCICGFCLEKRR